MVSRKVVALRNYELTIMTKNTSIPILLRQASCSRTREGPGVTVHLMTVDSI